MKHDFVSSFSLCYFPWHDFLPYYSVVGNEAGDQPPMNLKVCNFNLKLE
jgi:hypothetical protein